MSATRLIVLCAAIFISSQTFCISSQEVLARMMPGLDQEALLRARLKDQGVQLEDFSDFESTDDQPDAQPAEPATLADWGRAEAASFASPVWVTVTACQFAGTPPFSEPFDDKGENRVTPEEFPGYGSHSRRRIIEKEKNAEKRKAFHAHENTALMHGHWTKYLFYLIGSKLATDVACAGLHEGVQKLTGDTSCVPVFANTIAAVAVSLYNRALFGEKSRLISKEEILSNATADAAYETVQQGAKALWNASGNNKKRRLTLPIPQWLRDRGVTEKTVTSLAESGISELAMFIIKPLFIKPHTDTLWGVTKWDAQSNSWKSVHSDPPIYATHRY